MGKVKEILALHNQVTDLKQDLECSKWDYEELRRDYLRLETDMLELRPRYWHEKAQERLLANVHHPNSIIEKIQKTCNKIKAEEMIEKAEKRREENP